MSSTSVGSFRYMSPERLLGEQYDASGDIWSVGIMMVQLWTKRYPFEDNISTPIDLLTELESLHLDRLLQVCLISIDVCWAILLLFVVLLLLQCCFYTIGFVTMKCHGCYNYYYICYYYCYFYHCYYYHHDIIVTVVIIVTATIPQLSPQLHSKDFYS